MRMQWLVLRVVATALTLLVGVCAVAGELNYVSNKYHYAVSLPAGWTKIPDSELARFKASLPTQAEHLVYDAAFQRGNASSWFAWPYIIVQVIPAQRTGIQRLPTEDEFQSLVAMLTHGRAPSLVTPVVDSIQNTHDRTHLKAFLASLAAPSVQVDLASRRFRLIATAHEQAAPVSILMAMAFMEDGSVVQVNGYSPTSHMERNLWQFLEVARSVRAAPSIP